MKISLRAIVALVICVIGIGLNIMYIEESSWARTVVKHYNESINTADAEDLYQLVNYLNDYPGGDEKYEKQLSSYKQACEHLIILKNSHSETYITELSAFEKMMQEQLQTERIYDAFGVMPIEEIVVIEFLVALMVVLFFVWLHEEDVDYVFEIPVKKDVVREG